MADLNACASATEFTTTFNVRTYFLKPVHCERNYLSRLSLSPFLVHERVRAIDKIQETSGDPQLDARTFFPTLRSAPRRIRNETERNPRCPPQRRLFGPATAEL